MLHSTKPVIPNIVFTKKVLSDPLEASKVSRKLVSLLDEHQEINLDFGIVQEVTAEYADNLFCSSAIEMLAKQVRVNFRFSSEYEEEISETLEDSLNKYIPSTIGGTAMVH